MKSVVFVCLLVIFSVFGLTTICAYGESIDGISIGDDINKAIEKWGNTYNKFFCSIVI